MKQKYAIFIGLLENKMLLRLILAKIQHCPRAGIIQPELALLVISQPGYDSGVNEPASPTSRRSQSLAEKMLGICASVTRLCFVSVLQVGRRKRSRRGAGGPRSLSRPLTLDRAAFPQPKPTYLPTWGGRRTWVRKPGTRRPGALAPHVPQTAQM